MRKKNYRLIFILEKNIGTFCFATVCFKSIVGKGNNLKEKIHFTT